MQLKDPIVSKGIVFLEPNCVTMLGGNYQELEARQDDLFKRSLNDRLG
jgi:hypothetical protein